MKIAIDISQIAHDNTGVARYMKNLVTAICSKKGEYNYSFFFSSLRKRIDPKIQKIITLSGNRLITRSIPPTILSFLWNRLHLIHAESLIGEHDVIITSDWTEPPSKKIKITIVHDLVFKRYPETVHPTIRKNIEKKLEWVSQESNLIIADSETTKKDLIHFYGIRADKIIVIYPFVETSHVKPSAFHRIKHKYKITSPYILSVGKIEPRKNLQRLIKAFNAINKKNYSLILCGPKGWDSSITRQKNIRVLGEVSDEDLSSLYSHARCFVYPSIYEGFGYPVVEAMSFGCPVATSNTSSLKEIGENYSVIFDPLSVESIKNAIELLLYNTITRKEYIKKGTMRAEYFSKNNYLQLFNSAIKKAYDNRS
jgi:glycosyltransferase involved in cell wall biosynthesis